MLSREEAKRLLTVGTSMVSWYRCEAKKGRLVLI